MRTSKNSPTDADEIVAVEAETNGCKPFWHDGIFGWAYHCGCQDGTHYCDQQCSMISVESAKRCQQ